MTTKTKISIRIGLPEVEYKGNANTKKLLPKVNEFLKKELVEKEKIQVSNDCKVDLIKAGNKFGFAWAHSKFDNGFTAFTGPGEFRYKTKEVERVIKKMIEEFGLDTQVKYDRGMGVFVYNVFTK